MGAFILIFGITSAPVFAQEVEQPEVSHQSIIELIKQMSQNGMLTKEAADKLLHESEQSAPANAAVPSGVTAKKVAAPDETDTKKVAAPSGAVIQNVSAPSGVAAKEIAAPSEIDTKTVATPSGVVTQNVSAPSRVIAKEVAAPNEIDTKTVAAPSGVVTQDVSAPSGVAAKEVAAPNEIDTKTVAAPSGVVTQGVSAPSGVAAMKVAVPSEIDTKQVAAPITSAPAIAPQEKEQLEILHQSVTNLIKMLTQKGVMSQDAADQLVHDAEQSAAKTVAAQGGVATGVAAQNGVAATDVATPQNVAPAQEPVKPGVVRVPYVPEVVRREIKEEVKQEVLAQAKAERWGDPGALPDWLNRISWDGDFRLRFERDGFPAGNTPAVQYNPSGLTLIGNTTDTNNYLRVQARLGMKATVSDNTFAAFRLTTGTTTNPVSTNQTLGTGFNKSTLVFDRAYVQSTPYNWLTLTGGKIPNPWLSTDLVWDPDVNFEGVASQIKFKANDQWSGFMTVGAFPFQNIQKSNTVLSNSEWLYGYQLSAQWTAIDASTAQFGVALYDFKNVEGIPNTTSGSTLYNNTEVQSMQKGNSLMYVSAPGDPFIYGLASNFKELNITGKYDWAAFDPIHVMVTGDYVKNLGFDAAEILARTGLTIAPEITGYQAVLTVGSPRIKKQGDWQASFAYKYLERDAVLDALTDSDFNLGGTNAKGFIISTSYGLDKETSLVLRWISTDQISGPPLSIDILQADLNVRF
jgi:hypothetical protein